MVVQGSYTGFRLIDATFPSRPKVIVEVNDCAPNSFAGNQGDVAIYGNILSRSWNSNTPASGSSCDGNVVPPGFEGLHIFDITNEKNPTIVASVDLACGSHTQTMVPDLANNRLLVYVGSSSGTCRNFDIVEIPISNPAGARLLRQIPTENHPCHDIGIILGKAMKLGCAGGDSLGIYSLGGPDGGSLEEPKMMHHILPGIPSAGHSASFTYDGKVVVFGWEPGGGVEPRCTKTGTVLPERSRVQTDDMKSYFFFSVETGELLGKFILPREQSVDEVCTIHNYNIVPLKNKNGKPRYVLVSGNYSAGIECGRLLRPGERARRSPTPTSLRLPDGRGRRRLVRLLVQRADLRVQPDLRPAHLAARRSGSLTYFRTGRIRTRRRRSSRSTGKRRSIATLEREAAARRPPSFLTVALKVQETPPC